MLSYQHGYHAGNHADVLKHTVLCAVIDYLLQKDKPFLFLDTHAGRGLYTLQHPMSQKTGEYRDGIARVWGAPNLPAALAPYLSALQSFNPDGVLQYYAGSSLLAHALMRPKDRVIAHELHPQECLALRDNTAGIRTVRVLKEDGYAGLKAAMPPSERRGVVLVDPSYETASDDVAVVTALREAVKRFAIGTYLVWYPVVEKQRAAKLVKALAGLPVEKLLQLELMVREPVTGEGGMAGSGMLVINPPWTLHDAMQDAMPWLVQQLAPASGSFSVVWLKNADA